MLVGHDEGKTLWGTATAQAIRDHTRPRGTLVVKDGAVGATDSTDGKQEFVPAPAVDVVEPSVRVTPSPPAT